jgi:hypothetical protein
MGRSSGMEAHGPGDCVPLSSKHHDEGRQLMLPRRFIAEDDVVYEEVSPEDWDKLSDAERQIYLIAKDRFVFVRRVTPFPELYW